MVSVPNEKAKENVQDTTSKARYHMFVVIFCRQKKKKKRLSQTTTPLSSQQKRNKTREKIQGRANGAIAHNHYPFFTDPKKKTKTHLFS